MMDDVLDIDTWLTPAGLYRLEAIRNARISQVRYIPGYYWLWGIDGRIFFRTSLKPVYQSSTGILTLN